MVLSNKDVTPVVNLNSLQCQLQDSDQRRIELLNILLSFSHWFNSSGLYSPEAGSLVSRAIDRLREHSFTVACVGEFSRGKTELINALLFEQFKCRILPSRPGRTTMCPTEIGYDPNLPINSIQLLPLSTRKGGIGVNAFKQIPNHWVSLQFDLNSPASMQDALGRLAERQYLSEDQARDLGFDCKLLNRHPQNIHEVEVPVWRYGLINIDHPLLAQGLRIVDTPGLNALGTEPDMAINTLADADSLVFCLAADAPVSATDRTLWRDHINGEDNSHALVVINKVDSLWDDLISAPSEEASISSVRTDTALALGLPLQQVVPLSAKQALLAKARGDRALLARSNHEQFETLITARLNDCLKQLFKHSDVEDALALLRQTHQLMRDRLVVQGEALAQIQQLESGDFPEAMQAARDDIKDAHRRVHQVSILHRSYERQINQSFQSLMSVFGQKQVDRLINYLQTAAADPEPTLRPAIQATLKQIQLSLGKLAIEAERANQILADIYAEPVSGSGRLLLSSRRLSTHMRQQAYSDFKHRCEQFLHSVEQARVTDPLLIRYYLLALSQEVRDFVEHTNLLLIQWHQHALLPISYTNECTKQLLQKELLSLSRLHQGESANEQAAMVALRMELSQNEDHLYTLAQLIERVDHFEPLTVPTDKVVPLSFARRRTSH